MILEDAKLKEQRSTVVDVVKAAGHFVRTA
jgi:hypothetical protein